MTILMSTFAIWLDVAEKIIQHELIFIVMSCDDSNENLDPPAAGCILSIKVGFIIMYR